MFDMREYANAMLYRMAQAQSLSALRKDECPHCQGAGFVGANLERCAWCAGNGYVVTEVIEVTR